MCDCEEVFTCLPSIVSWVRAHAALGGSGTNCVGKSRPPSQRQSSRHWVKAHSDPQPLPAPPHKHRQLCNLLQMDTRGQSHFPCSDCLSSPLQAPAGGKRGCTEEKQMSTREQWVMLCCRSLETTSAAQQDNCRALHQCWQLPSIHYLFVCWRGWFPYTWDVPCWSMFLADLIFLRHSPNTPSCNISQDLPVW